MELIIADSYEKMSRMAADIICEQLAVKPDSVLGLATGSTPLGMYDCLVEDYLAGKISFAKVSSFNLDEYVGLSAANEQSYHYYMRKNLFERIDIDLERTHVPSGNAFDTAQACKDYDKAIEDAGGIDLQVLGIGNNGHIGFNEPDDHFSVGTFVVNLAQSTIEANSRLFESIDCVPRRAVTMGIGQILRAKKIMLLANGNAKALALTLACFGPVKPELPASALQLHPNVVVIADEQAASLCHDYVNVQNA